MKVEIISHKKIQVTVDITIQYSDTQPIDTLSYKLKFSKLGYRGLQRDRERLSLFYRYYDEEQYEGVYCTTDNNMLRHISAKYNTKLKKMTLWKFISMPIELTTGQMVMLRNFPTTIILNWSKERIRKHKIDLFLNGHSTHV
jgi:hypothetical protein